jgi:hypothetical protein
MKDKFHIILLVLISFLSVNLDAQNTKTKSQILLRDDVIAVNSEINFNQAIRLSQLLQYISELHRKTETNKSIDWSYASLYEPASKARVNRREAVISILEETARSAKGDLCNGARQLSKFIQAQPILSLVQKSIDYDKVRMLPRFNPLLAGRYTVHLPARDNSIQGIGAIDVNDKYKWYERESAQAFTKRIKPSRCADPSWLYVFFGQDYAKFPVASWNTIHRTIPTGSLILVPFISMNESDTLLLVNELKEIGGLWK